MDNFYITTPIYYVNANPHLGHAYTTIVGDAATRMHKMLGESTFFLTGTDEHGDKIAQAAEARHLSPRQFADEISSHFRQLWPGLSIATDIFTRTTDPEHIKAVQDFLQRVYDAGDIYFGEFGGYYCYGCERFYTEKELESGVCPQHLTPPEFISEKNYFFRMSRYLPWLKEYIESHPDVVRPDRYRKEALAMLEAGVLEDLCISRPKSRLTWGIELPFDPDYVCYVWFDALVSYISGLGWPKGENYRRFWPGDHLIAKDILKPHAIFWPCMLKSAGLPVFRHLNVHGYWLSRQTKMSKSLGNVVDPGQAVREYGLDAFRYFLLREMHFGSDANFSEEGVLLRINADLSNDLGNLFSRVLSMNGKYFEAAAPACSKMEKADTRIMEFCRQTLENYLPLFVNFEFARGLECLWEFVRALNKYVDSQAPWALAREGNKERLGTVIGLLLAAMRKVAVALWPVMPDAASAMLRQLGCAGATAKEAPTRDFGREVSAFEFIAPGTALAASSNLFPRMELRKKDAVQQARGQKKASAEAPRPDAARPASFEAFSSLEILVGEVLEARKHPDADRILVLEIDFGNNCKRQILSGLAQHYAPADLTGKLVCAITNLAPRKIRGLVSQGMVLTVEDGDKVALLEPPAGTARGARIA